MTGPVISSPGALPLSPPTGAPADATPATSSGAVGIHVVSLSSTPPSAALRSEVLAPADSSAPQRAPAEVRAVPTRPSARDLAHKALPDRDALELRIGAPPKKDINILGFVYHRSTGYKEVQAKLDAYHEAVKRCGDGSAPVGGEELRSDKDGKVRPVSKERLAQVDNALDVHQALEELETALENYEKGERHSHKKEMGDLLADVRREKAMVSGVLGEMHADTDDGEPTFPLMEVFALRRVAPDLSATQVHALMGKGWTTDDFAQMWSSTLEPHGLTREDLQFAALNGYSKDTVDAYRAARLPINAGTRITTHLEGEIRPLGKGAVNQVFRGEVRTAGGERMVGVFKPEISGLGALPDAAASSGIDTERPQWACRNVATSRLDQQLRFNLVPPTGLAMVGGKLGTVMEMAEGISPQVDGNIKMKLAPAQAARLRDDPAVRDAVLREQGFQDGGRVDGDELVVAHAGGARVAMDFGDAGLRRELTKLQWLDALTGQVDRHAGNYFVGHGAAGGVKVTAIDNDLAFGKKLRAAGDIYSPGGVYKGAQLPGVVDRATCDALKGLTPGAVAVLCEGLLDQDEIAATQQRLADIHTHLAKLEREGHVIEPGAGDAAWASSKVGELLGIDQRDVGAVIDQAKKPEIDQGPARQARLKTGELDQLVAKGKPPAEAEAEADRFARDMVQQRILRAGTKAEEAMTGVAAEAGYVARDRMQQALGQYHRNPVLDVTRFPSAATPPTALAEDLSA